MNSCRKTKGGPTMPRIARMKNPDDSTCFHVISRTALPCLPFGSVENDELPKIIKRFSRIYFVEIFGFALMGNHHILLRWWRPIYREDWPGESNKRISDDR